MNALFHVGVGKLKGAPGRGSGRYPLGSGERPYQDYGGGKIKKRRDLADASIEGLKTKSTKDMDDDELRERIRRNNLEKEYNKILNRNNPLNKVDDVRSIVNNSQNAINRLERSLDDSQKSSWSRMDLSNMSNKELLEAINRENLEIQYSKLFNNNAPEITKGQEYAKKILKGAGTYLDYIGTALPIALAIAKLV